MVFRLLSRSARRRIRASQRIARPGDRWTLVPTRYAERLDGATIHPSSSRISLPSAHHWQNGSVSSRLARNVWRVIVRYPEVLDLTWIPLLFLADPLRPDDQPVQMVLSHHSGNLSQFRFSHTNEFEAHRRRYRETKSARAHGLRGLLRLNPTSEFGQRAFETLAASPSVAHLYDSAAALGSIAPQFPFRGQI